MFKKIAFIFTVFSLFNSLYALDLSEISKVALKQNKLILVSVESKNCRYCEKMNKKVFNPKKYATQINKNYVQKIVMIEETKLPENFKVKNYPTNIILDPKNMTVVDEFVGYMGPLDFVAILDIVYEEEAEN